MTLNQGLVAQRQDPSSTLAKPTPVPRCTVIDQILGPRTLLEFDELPAAERDAILRKYMAQQTGPIVVDATATLNELNRDVEAANNLQSSSTCPADDDSDLHFARNRLRSAAHTICFSENAFIVHILRLQGFLKRVVPYSNKSMSQLVRDITIAIPNSYGFDPHEVRDMAKELRLLLDFTPAEKVGVRIIGPGREDGTDWYTQETIRLISPVVRDLISQFGIRFSIVRFLPNGKSQDIRAYWEAPCTWSDGHIEDGDTSFQTVMQFQVEDWIKRNDADNLNSLSA